MTEDPRVAAARRRRERLERAERADPEDTAQRGSTPTGWSELERAAIVETALQQAIRQGQFDDLPGAGKPIPGLDAPYDPEWWIKQKIEREQLTGLGPPALTLRVEHAQMEARLDALASETEVRDTLEDFNHRVVEARRQLQGGPPVVTPTHDVEADVAAWRERRAQRAAAEAAQQQAAEPPARRRSWWRRRG
ncbi:DnaJ family domain-containing protein [Agrococcus baldri]|uniref:DnaJ homologue subfamily C member 28 conserved domain-containing protein n=1 Tax=Agrococcus baldri TaxID=153730 RepID=A0AA87URN0_9MICO|nr:DUF1992 domain-containing protein [Agrococcus baldri]GEK79724.1 hypothetical protein ABA31_10750 [Agrococcus baldri]